MTTVTNTFNNATNNEIFPDTGFLDVLIKATSLFSVMHAVFKMILTHPLITKHTHDKHIAIARAMMILEEIVMILYSHVHLYDINTLNTPWYISLSIHKLIIDENNP